MAAASDFCVWSLQSCAPHLLPTCASSSRAACAPTAQHITRPGATAISIRITALAHTHTHISHTNTRTLWEVGFIAALLEASHVWRRRQLRSTCSDTDTDTHALRPHHPPSCPPSRTHPTVRLLLTFDRDLGDHRPSPTLMIGHCSSQTWRGTNPWSPYHCHGRHKKTSTGLLERWTLQVPIAS